MDILDRDLQEVDLQKQDAFRLMATYNKQTGDKYFDWVQVIPEKNVMIHESLRRLRKKQLSDNQDLQDLLPPLIVAVDKVGGDKSVHFASERDKTEENVKKVEEMKPRIFAEFRKFSTRFLENGKTSSFDDIASIAEQQAALWDSIPDEDLFKTPRSINEANMQKEILEARMLTSTGYERARYRHFLGYD